MPEQSTKDEMNAAIRGARERHSVPRSLAGEAVEAPPPPQPVAPPAPEPEPEAEKPKGLLSRLLGR